MSGSGGSGIYTGGRSGPPDGGSSGGGGQGAGGSGGSDACALVLESQLFGPVPGVADALNVGDALDIRLVGNSPPQVGVFAPTQGGAQAGSVAGMRQLPTLIDCLQQGVRYTGVVLSVNGSAVRIRIENA